MLRTNILRIEIMLNFHGRPKNGFAAERKIYHQYIKHKVP